MRPIEGKAKSVRDLLQGKKYSIDYYQREYRWESKQIRELIDDLSEMFLEDFESGIDRVEVANFPHYFLGSIIISQRDNQNYIVDGQQRLTSLTLLLIFLRKLQPESEERESINDLIFSARFGQRNFNLAVDERARCMEALYEGRPYDASSESESVQNLCNRYLDIEAYFPAELQGEVLPYFTDWLTENVHLVEITAFTDEDAYTIFETMNDRGISLNPTEMLKGYLLANIEPRLRLSANEFWRKRIQAISERSDDHAADFFKAWLRSQYSAGIRQRRKGAVAEDFERIGTEYHRWVRNKRDLIGLDRSGDFFKFVREDFNFFSNQYLRLRNAQERLTTGLEHVHYNAGHGFTLQEMLLLAPLQPGDPEDVIVAKMRIVARFVDILLTWRIWNFRSIAYSTMQYAMFLVMRNIRGLTIESLASTLHERLLQESETFTSNERLSLHQQNRYALHRILARMTDYVETNSGLSSRYAEYFVRGAKRFEVEHIWAQKPERHRDEFAHHTDFAEYRNRIGGLLLLPRSFNASYGDLTYEEKLPHYLSQNLLARSLHPQAYEHNPGFVRFVSSSGLPFKPHTEFQRADLESRSDLYTRLAQQIWNPKDLLREIGG